MRVLSWNIYGLRGGSRAVSTAIRLAAPDVVCAQECPRGPVGALRLWALARSCGLHVAAGGRGAGVAVLVRDPGTVVTGSLEREPRRRKRGPLLAYPRATATAVLRTPTPTGDVEVSVSSVHLDVDERARLAHLERLNARVASTTGLHVVAGDLNAGPGTSAWEALTAHLGDLAPDAGPTYPATAVRSPRKRIDAVVASPGIVASSYRTGLYRGHDAGVSDHLPLLATLVVAGTDRPERPVAS